jgi:hypothetical protein
MKSSHFKGFVIELHMFFWGQICGCKIGWIFVESNGVSVLGGNCKNIPINIMSNLPNGNMFDFDFCNFKCIITSMEQLTIDILLTIII